MTEESVLRELADFALREYREGRTKPLTQFIMEEAAQARIAELIESGSIIYPISADEQLWRRDGEEWALVEAKKEGEADGRDTREAPEDQP